MSEVFIQIFNLGLTAGWLVLAILVCRPLMKRAPRWINCLLWGIVGLRLCLPFKLESIFSLVPSAEPLPDGIMMSPAPEINSGVGVLNDAVNPIISTTLAPQVGASANPMQIIIAIAAFIWVVGIALMLGYGIVSYILLRLRVRVSVRGEENLCFCDDVDSPFILGVIRPRIYVPSGMSGEALEHVLAHEKAHLRRGDHLWKPLGFALLAFYWFNPLLWIAYALLCRDIEAACDEKVIKEMSDEAKKGYSEALLACSLHRKRIMACPLAFGEVGVKQRIKSVLNYKKPAFWVIIVALIATLVLSVCFLTNPKESVRDMLVPGSEWRCADGVVFNATVESAPIRMVGNLTVGEESHEVMVSFDYDGSRVYADILRAEIADAKYEGNGLSVSSDEYFEWYEKLADENRLLSGRLEARGGELVLKIETDNLGIGEKKLTFKKTKDASLDLVPFEIDVETRYVRIIDSGSDNPRLDISMVQLKRDGADVIFVLHWKNKSMMHLSTGKSFEIYIYGEDGERVPLAGMGYWTESAIAVSRKGMYMNYNVTEHYDISAPGKYRFESHGAWVEFEVLNETIPDTNNESENAPIVFDPSYSPYDSSRKYDVYVWQFSQNSFYFGLLESKERDWLDDELWDLKGTTAAVMRQTLLKQNLGPNDVNIIHWQHPLSSYIGDFWVIWPYMNDNTPQENFYYAMIYDMLFGSSPRDYYPTATESSWIDFDGDGEKETHMVILGLVDGKFMFRYIISEDNKTAAYDDTFYPAPMSLKFFEDENGKLRLRGVTEDGVAHIYEITLQDGHVKLNEVGTSSDNSMPPQTELALSVLDLSIVDRIVITDGATGKKAYLVSYLDKQNFNAVLSAVKEVRASNPVSNRGYSGFAYNVELYYDYQEIYSFAIYSDVNGPFIICGYYETVGGFDYPARYKLTEPTYDHLAAVLGNCFK